jgi:hypothetical protein
MRTCPEESRRNKAEVAVEVVEETPTPRRD